jgi:general secretion pathway protein M
MRPPAFWTARSARERAVLAWGALACAALLLVALVWLPVERSRARLAADLPALRASVVEMRAQAEDAKRLRALPARSATVSPPLSTLLAAGTLTQGLPGARLSALDGKRLRLAVDDASWTRLAEWISAAQSLHGLVVETATVEALAGAGRVRADLVLVAP